MNSEWLLADRIGELKAVGCEYQMVGHPVPSQPQDWFSGAPVERHAPKLAGVGLHIEQARGELRYLPWCDER